MNDSPFKCSFCGNSQFDVAHMIVAAACICDECIKKCVGALVRVKPDEKEKIADDLRGVPSSTNASFRKLDAIDVADIDSLILADAKMHFQKVVMTIAEVGHALGVELEEPIAKSALDDVIAARVAALVADGRLESAGNLKRWRHSEVRLSSQIKSS